jgi:hypothetical protein
MVATLRALIATEGADASFSKPYWEIAHEVPDVLVAHVRLWRLLESVRAR